VFASVRPESFGLGAAEAMAARRPVVVSDAGALPEVVGSGHPWVAPRGNATALAEVLGSVIRTLPATDVVDEQRARWETEFSPAAGRRHLAELMEHLAAEGVVGARS
jgi:glycosyltransferase involved in cell wall biosynthesis